MAAEVVAAVAAAEVVAAVAARAECPRVLVWDCWDPEAARPAPEE